MAHALVFSDELEPGAAEISVAHVPDARLDAYRAAHLNSSRRPQDVEVAANDDVFEFPPKEDVFDFAMMAAVVANELWVLAPLT